MKQYVVSAEEMKRYDSNTTKLFQVPSLLLMERAALETVGEICRCVGGKEQRMLVVAGSGNNGGDGLAIGRIFMLRGWQVDFVLTGDPAKQSAETRKQGEILQAYGVSFYDRIPNDEYDVIVDAILGIGLTRPVEGALKETVEKINESPAFVCSVDMPTGIQTDTGQVLGAAVRADLTVTYGFVKRGQILYPGSTYCGKLVCRDIGIDRHSFEGEPPRWYCYERAEELEMPDRRPDGNKGTFGKILVVAGSRKICGAAMLAAKAAFRVGAGMVQVVTASENRELLLRSIPETMLTVYEEQKETGEQKEFISDFVRALQWADTILIGPGIGMGKTAKWLLTKCICESSLPLVIDADGLNLLSQDAGLQEAIAGQQREVILTPHLGEFARLYGYSVQEAKEGLMTDPGRLAQKLGCTVVCKDARTVVTSGIETENFLNTTGNSGMATAGSGDVLAGMIAGLVGQCRSGRMAAENGVYLHGLAGDLAAAKKTERAVMASDLIDSIQDALREMNRAKEEAAL